MTIDISELIYASGGEVFGKIRIQKIVYLLDKLGIGSDFEFSYHHYGPYSSDLSDDLDFKCLFGDIRETIRNRKSDGVPYSVFNIPSDFRPATDSIGNFKLDQAKKYIVIMNEYSSTELELAATAYWLAREESVPNWEQELKIRKGIKTEGGRTEKALKLLRELGLDLN